MTLGQVGMEAVEQAIAEYDRIGPEQMLRKYRGRGPSTRWYVRFRRKHYDQKLILHAAHVLQGLGEPPPFNAGQARRSLERLGFSVVPGDDGR